MNSNVDRIYCDEFVQSSGCVTGHFGMMRPKKSIIAKKPNVKDLWRAVDIVSLIDTGDWMAVQVKLEERIIDYILLSMLSEG